MKNDFDVIIPCYNDQESLVPLLQKLNLIFSSNINILVVDNASSQPVVDYICDVNLKISNLKIIRLANNVGYSGAIFFGLKHSKSEYVGVIDSDHEDPPEDLSSMYSICKNESLDCVYGVKTKREASLRLKFFYKLFYRLYKLISDSKVQVDAGEFAVYRRLMVDRMIQFSEPDIFVRGIRSIVGGKQKEFLYQRQKRYIGETKFNFYKSLDLAIDGLLFNTKKPLRFFSIFGFGLFLLSGLILMVNSFLKIANNFLDQKIGLVLPEGLTQTSILIYFMLLSNFMLLVIIGEVTLKNLINSRSRPLYHVERVDEFNSHTE